MPHLTQIQGYEGNLSQLAKELGNLRYDALAEFLAHLAVKLRCDADADAARGRAQLANALRSSADHSGSAAQSIEQAWRICEPYMAGNDGAS